MTTKRDRAAAAAFFNDQPEWDLTIAHWIETGEKRYGMGTVRPNVLALAEAFAKHSLDPTAKEVDEERFAVDYSKPVGWFCPRLGVTWRSLRHHAEECWGDTQCLARLSPVYLPPPEVVTAKEPLLIPETVTSDGSFAETKPLVVPTWLCTTPEGPVSNTKGKTQRKREAIPAFTPLAVPEQTTWGATGGEEAVCASFIEVIGDKACNGCLDYVLGDDKWFEYAASVYDSGEVLIHEPTSGRPASTDPRLCGDMRCDITTAINYVESRGEK